MRHLSRQRPDYRSKSSITGIGWKQSSLTTLHNFVRVVHTTTKHAYYFSKYIFL
ncbi:uncharacterized protein EV154DRAFT_579354, partial [Mucor mucedo]|uniref:uncharacterized protein n=1 Tax=Mucor mucedo TaxID=29922 RepID=UPI00221E5605